MPNIVTSCLPSRSCTTFFFLLPIVAYLFVGVCRGMKTNFASTIDAQAASLIVDSFGAASGGIVEGKFVVTPQNSSAYDYSYTLLLVMTDSQRAGWFSTISDTSAITDYEPLCVNPSLIRYKLRGSGNFTITLPSTDRYSALLVQCQQALSNNPIDVKLSITMKNIQPAAGQYSYLTIEQVPLVRLYEGELIIYSLMFLVYSGQVYMFRNYARHVHYCFVATLFFTVLYYIMEYWNLNYQNSNGVKSHGIKVLLNIFEHLGSFSTLASLLIISLGWAVARFWVPDREYYTALSLLFVLFIVGFGSAICVDGNDQRCRSLSLFTYVLKVMVLVGAIIGMNFNAAQQRAILIHSPWTPSVPLQYVRAKQYGMYRMFFIIYLIMPTVFSVVQTEYLSWEDEWISISLSEILDIFMIFFVGANFGPLPEQLLLRAFDGSYAAAALVARDE